MSEVLKSIVQPLESSASVSRIYGEPVSAHGRTVIPVARIAYGFGGASGHGTGRAKAGVGEGEGGGEGGGGGIVAVPVGVIEITEDHTKYIPLRDEGKLAFAVFCGAALGFLWARRKR